MNKEDRFDQYFKAMKRGAKTRGLNVSITADDLRRQYKKQKGKCAYTGQSIAMEDYNISLDRIDSKKGYTKRNIQWVRKAINTMKYTFSHDDFIEMCEKVTKHMRKQK